MTIEQKLQGLWGGNLLQNGTFEYWNEPDCSAEQILELFRTSYTDLLDDLAGEIDSKMKVKNTHQVYLEPMDERFNEGLDTAISIIKDKLSPKEDSIN